MTRERILIVDDDEDLRTLMCEGLQRRGMDVEMVDSAQACLRRIDEVAFDVVVTDVQMMPGISGIELSRLLSLRIPPLVSIVVTNLRDLTTKTAALASGAFEFISKPIKLAALEAAIRRALGPRPVRLAGARASP
jgi:DNA-binding NtrC family response regulator